MCEVRCLAWIRPIGKIPFGLIALCLVICAHNPLRLEWSIALLPPGTRFEHWCASRVVQHSASRASNSSVGGTGSERGVRKVSPSPNSLPHFRKSCLAVLLPTSYMAYHSDYDFVGGYNHALQSGILHVANHHISPGKNSGRGVAGSSERPGIVI